MLIKTEKNAKYIKAANIFLILISIIRVGLNTKVPYAFYTVAGFDDQLLIDYAKVIRAGHWLGGYTYCTLVKGISFPVFLALLNRFYIPACIGVGCFYVLSSFVFVKAVSKRIKNNIFLFLLYVLLLYSPIHISLIQRFYRTVIVPSAALLTFGCLLGAYFERKSPLKKQLSWLFGAGISLSFFYYIREDSIWIMPFVIVVLCIILVTNFIDRKKEALSKKIFTVVVSLLPVILLCCTNLAYRACNYYCYKIFETNDRTGTNFVEVMNDLYHIQADGENEDVWLSYEAIEKAEKVSPTLASISDQVKAKYGDWSSGHGDLFSWGLRQAVNDAGYYTDAVTANEFYGKIHKELQEAFKTGKLEKKTGQIYLSQQAAGVSVSDFGKYIVTGIEKLIEVGRYNYLYEINKTPYNDVLGTPTQIRSDEAFLGTLGFYNNDDNGKAFDDAVVDPLSIESDSAVKWLNRILRSFRTPGHVISIIALICFIIFTIDMVLNIREKKYETFEVWLMSLGMYLSAYVLTFGVAFFSRWMHNDSVYSIYGSASYILVDAVQYIAIYYAITCIIRMMKRLRKK